MFDVKPYGKGVEMQSTSLQGFVAGIVELMEDDYIIDYNAVMQNGILMVLYANRKTSAQKNINKDNQMIIDLNTKIFELEEKEQIYTGLLMEKDDEIKSLKKNNTKKPGRPKKGGK
jgi:hypothetical protein